MPAWLTLALAALLVWSVQRAISKAVFQTLSTPQFYLLSAFVSLPLYLPTLVLDPPPLAAFPGAVGLSAMMAVTFGVTTEAIRRGPVGRVGLASAVVGDHTNYENQLRNRTEAPAHRFRFGLPMLASLPVAEAMRPPRLVLTEDLSAREAHEQLVELGLPGAPVADEDRVFHGSVDIDRVADADVDARVRSLADGSLSAVPIEATLDAVVEIFATDHAAWVPVLDAERRIVGVVATADLIRAYRHALSASLRSLRSIFSGSILVEEEVRSHSSVRGRSVGDGRWPNGTVVIAIQRGDQLIFPEPSTEVREDDVLSALVPKSVEDRFRDALGVASGSNENIDVPML